MQGHTIAILENRAGEQLADLVKKRGGTPLRAPALAEVPDLDPEHIRALVAQWGDRVPDVFVFQTGVGTRALFTATDRLGLTADLMHVLVKATVVVRGPKPTAALRARGVRIDLAAAEPFTTHEVLAAIDAATSLGGKRVVVQRYGETNRELADALQARGAEVSEIATYRWSLPADTQPLIELMDALGAGRVSVVTFTSAAQVSNLFALAVEQGREASLRSGLQSTRIASIGPVCSAALARHGVRVDIEASPPKLGPLVSAIESTLAS